MDDLEFIKKHMPVTEAPLHPGKISKLDHAKRIGRMGMKDTLRLLDVYFQEDLIENPIMQEQLKELHDNLREYLKILHNIWQSLLHLLYLSDDNSQLRL